MNTTYTRSIMFQDIETLTLSNGFKAMAALNGFGNLDEILSFRLSFLLKREGFTPQIQQEFILYLQEHKLADQLKQY